jgi:hypothetical protein
MATKTVAARLTELTARLERQEAELMALKSERRTRPSAAAPDQKSSRRDLFKLAGGAVAGAAGASVLGTQAALAVDGSAVLAGVSNSETSTTTIDATGATGDVTGFLVKGKGASPAVRGEAGASGPGVYGQGAGGASGPGVYGQTVGDGDGVSGLGTGTGAGVSGTGGGGSGPGVQAMGGGPNGSGVVATGLGAGSGILALGGAGGNGAQLVGSGTGAPLNLAPSGTPGPPGSGGHAAGDVWFDSSRILWVCINGGTPGTFARLGAVNPTFFGGAQANTGGVMNLLPNPIRILDTRSGSPWAGGSTHTLQVTGTADLNGSSTKVPAGALAVIGNVTAVFPQGAGDLRLFPHGASLPTTSNLNYNLNVTIANSATIGLDGSGRMDIFVDVSTTHVLFDASGFVF